MRKGRFSVCPVEQERKYHGGTGVESGKQSVPRAQKGRAGICHKFHSAITPRILAQFPWSKMRLNILIKTFQMMPKTCQSNQYSLRYQLISAGH